MDSNKSNIQRVGLYPHVEPFKTFMMPVGDGHDLYVEQCGRVDGIPVITLHGGPGGGASPAIRRFFDPTRYHIIVFDQRGCGRSRPFSSLENNTTGHLISDIEAIRKRLKIDRWQVFGGSWGATLALSYARAHPDHVTNLILRGVFTCTQAELDWFYKDGAARIFPDNWDRFVSRLSTDERKDVLKAYHTRLTEQNIEDRQDDAIAWAQWESALISMGSGGHSSRPDLRRADAISRIETHYFVNRGFLERDGVLLEDTDHLQSIPGTIVQGRYDLVTPPRTAWDLARSWSKAHLEIVPDAGHAAGEPGIVDGLVRATDAYANNSS